MSISKGILSLAGALLWVALSTAPAMAWQTKQTASALCAQNNRAAISWTFTNTEPNKQKYSMDIVATDLASGVSSPKVTAAPGQTVNGTIVPGDKNVGQGQIKFELTWTDGRSGVDSRKASYDATNCVDKPEEKKIEVCRDGQIVTIKESQRLDSDTNPPCPENKIEVCRDGKIITIKEDERRSTDTNAPCVLGEEDMPKTLPNTGIAGAASGLIGVSAMGASLRSWLESRSMLRAGTLKKRQ